MDLSILSSSETRRLLSAGGAEVLGAKYFLLFPEALHRYFSVIEDGLSASRCWASIRFLPND